MKKITFSLLFALATFSFAYSQNLEIIKPGGTHHLNDSTIVVYGLTSDSLVTQSLFVVNTSGSSIVVNAKREVASEVAGAQNEICWAGTCYSTSTSVSPVTETLGAHDTANLGNSFTGDYLPHAKTGITTINYEFFDTGNPNDTAHITVEYCVTVTGIANVKDGGINFSAPYPNPANTNVSFSYSLTNGVEAANLKIFNLLGECVQTLPLDASKTKITIDVQSMSSGIYVCEVEAEGCQPTYQKLIVSH
jgi:hypothetical protein